MSTGVVVLKSPREIELMRAAGRVVARVLDEMENAVAPGVTTRELDSLADRLIREAGGQALFRGVRHKQAAAPFPASVCTSVNDAVVHGVPDDRPLQDGDVVTVDCGVRLKGYCADGARTFRVGRVPAQARDLLRVTRETLDLALAKIGPGVVWNSIARLMDEHVRLQGFTVVRGLCGHGIGREMHEAPSVLNYEDAPAGDFTLESGLTLAVEPMIVAGRAELKFRDRLRWTMVTRDGSLAAHEEHTVAVHAGGCDVLTDGR